MIKEGSIAVWRSRLESYQPGRVTIPEWCRAEGVSVNQFHYWRGRVSDAAKLDKPGHGLWQPLELVETKPITTPAVGMTLRVGGASIDIQPGFDPVMLRAVVRALEVDRC